MPNEGSSKDKEVEKLEELVRENETALDRIRQMVADLKGELSREPNVNGNAGDGGSSGFNTASAQRNSRLQGGD